MANKVTRGQAAQPGDVRSVLLWLHRWIGLTLGMIFAVVALSGSLLLFQAQYFTWAHGEMIPENLSPEPRFIDRWVENARAALPDAQKLSPIVIWPPHIDHNVSDAGSVVFGGREPGGLGNMGLVSVLVAPNTGEVLGVVDIDRTPVYAPIFLHRDLWAGEAGQIIVGIMAVGALIMLPLGLYLWWPRQGVLRKLSPRPLSSLRHASPLHHWLGSWALLFLFVLAFSGLYLSQPTWLEPALTLLPEGQAQEVSKICNAPFGFDAAIAAAQTRAPGASWTSISVHDPEKQLWDITFEAGSDAAGQETGDMTFQADLKCGTVVLEETDQTRSPRTTVGVWLTTLHDGTMFGTAGEIAVTLLGLIPIILAWSGIRMWLRRKVSARAGR